MSLGAGFEGSWPLHFLSSFVPLCVWIKKKTISQLPASAVTVPLIVVMPSPTRTRRNSLFPKLFWAAILAPQWRGNNAEKLNRANATENN